VYNALLQAPSPAVRVKANIVVGSNLLASDAAGAQAHFELALQETTAGADRAEARAGWLRSAVALGRVAEGLGEVKAWLANEDDLAMRGELAVAAVRALREEGQASDALALAEQYADAGGFELAMERAGALRDLGRSADAAALLAGLTPADPADRPWVAETQADALIDAGDLKAAKAVLVALRDAGGNACFGLARVAREQGDFAFASEQLTNCDDPRAAIERGQVFEDMGKLVEARQTWERLTLADDVETQTAASLGLARLAMNDDNPLAALAALDKRVVIDPGYALSIAQVRGEALRLLNRIDDARAVYSRLGDGAEERTVRELGLAECAYQAGDAVGADEHFRGALDQANDPFYRAQALSGMSRAASEQGNSERAREILEQLEREYPEQTAPIDAARVAIGAP